MGTWIKCSDEHGQIIYVNIANAITLLRNESHHRGTVIAFMGTSDHLSVVKAGLGRMTQRGSRAATSV